MVNKINAMENKHLLGIYAVVNQVTLRPKEIIHMLIFQGDLVSTICWVWVSQTLKIWGSGLNRPKNENEKNERKIENRPRKKIFSRKVTW